MAFKLNKIYNEDCLRTLKRIDDQSIDLVITSPPYNMNWRIHGTDDKVDPGRYSSRWESFLSGIENQNIQYDNRLGIYRSGKSYGKLHNHGGAFRLASGKRNFLRTLYETYEEL